MTTTNPITDETAVPEYLPPNIVEELPYLIDGFETTADTVPAGVAYAVAKGLLVYGHTGDETLAVETKEAYRCAVVLENRGHSASNSMRAAAEAFERGDRATGKSIAAQVAREMSGADSIYSAVTALAGEEYTDE